MLLIFAVRISAQCYSINKLNFDYHQYIPEYGDVYNPAMSGVCSFLIPGLGQLVSGEPGRGLAFFGGYLGCAVILEVGAAQLFTNKIYSNTDNYGFSGNSNKGAGTMLIGFGGMIFVGVWSIVDAVKVAKVNNMYYRSLRQTSSIKLNLSPYVDHISINNQVATPVGMTMKVIF